MLQELHNEENIMNKRIRNIDCEVNKKIPAKLLQLSKEKGKLTKAISKNMKLRNKIINEMTSLMFT